jgi:hypothetical protein
VGGEGSDHLTRQQKLIALCVTQPKECILCGCQTIV